MSRAWPLGSAFLVLLSCTPAAPPPAPTASPINASFNQSWNAVIDVLAEYNIPVKTLDRSSGFVAAEVSALSIADLSEFSTCGGILDLMINKERYGIATYNILVRGDSSTSSVKTTARFVHGATTCGTKNVLESRVQEAVKTRAEASSGRVGTSVTQPVNHPTIAPEPKPAQSASTETPHPVPAMRNENITNDPARGRATIGTPETQSAATAAKYAFAAAENYLGSHNWAKAEESYRVALQFDGSVAKYHAALGSLLMTQKRWAEAEAEFSAATLLDLDNPDYRRLLKEARSKR
jgi:hypothetical protein